MSRSRLATWFLALMLACLLFALLCLRPANGAVRASRVVAAPAVLVIDFDAAQVPMEMRAAITQAIANRPASMLPGQSFAVLSLQVDPAQPDWALATIGVMDSNPEAVGMGDDGALLVLARGGAEGSWQAALEGTSTFQAVVAHTPDTLLNASAKLALQPADVVLNPQDVTLLFPWDRSQRWYLTQGWHYGNYVDLAPLASAPNKWVLAAHGGVVTRTCLGPLTANVQVRHTSGLTTNYAHLDVTSVPTGLLGATVSQGRLLGLAYNKAFTNAQDHCGYSSGPHVHFGLPSQSSIVDGWTTHPDNTWTKAGVTKLVNASFDSTNVLNRGLPARAFLPLLLR